MFFSDSKSQGTYYYYISFLLLIIPILLWFCIYFSMMCSYYLFNYIFYYLILFYVYECILLLSKSDLIATNVRYFSRKLNVVGNFSNFSIDFLCYKKTTMIMIPRSTFIMLFCIYKIDLSS